MRAWWRRRTPDGAASRPASSPRAWRRWRGAARSPRACGPRSGPTSAPAATRSMRRWSTPWPRASADPCSEPTPVVRRASRVGRRRARSSARAGRAAPATGISISAPSHAPISRRPESSSIASERAPLVAPSVGAARTRPRGATTRPVDRELIHPEAEAETQTGSADPGIANAGIANADLTQPKRGPTSERPLAPSRTRPPTAGPRSSRTGATVQPRAD